MSMQSRFHITAKVLELCDPEFLSRAGFPAPDTCTFRAVLQHSGLRSNVKRKAPTSYPIALDLTSIQSLTMVRPLESPSILKSEPDVSFAIRLGVLADGQTFLHTTELPWVLPETPLLVTKGVACSDGVPLIDVPENATDVQFTLVNEFPQTESVHLHGSRFQIIALNSVTGNHSLSAPLLRDTVAIPGGGSVVLRLLANNPGMWMLEALSANLRQRGAATVLRINSGAIPPMPHAVPVTGSCSESQRII